MKTKIAIAARPGHGAIISLPGLQLGAQTPQSMEIAVAQALGIVFGTACKTNDCVMPAKNKSVNTQVENALVTINQIVTSGKEICRDCSAAINKAITRMQSPS